MRVKINWLFIIALFYLVACSDKQSNKTLESDSVEELVLVMPGVPDSVVGAEERAAFVARHFWDDLDFARDSRSLDTAFVEQNFANFLAVLSVSPEPAVQSAVSGLLNRASASSRASELLGHVVDRYLDDPNSPMRNEELYILFLREFAVDQSLPEERRAKANYRLGQAMKNRLGTKGADFGFVDREGNDRRLYDLFGDGMTLVMFYDPDCEQCREVKERLSHAPKREDVRVVAIDTMGDRERWEETKSDFPTNWIVGFATDPVEDDEIYVIRAMPTFYLFDADGKVIAKDPDVGQLIGN